LHKYSLASTKWTVEKYQIPGATLARDLFTEGSHLLNIYDAMGGNFRSAHNR
jgi:hypothetical protein